ncbi:restriction endonuclease subunit S [Franconibacter daqui]|uniref:restriction endonuclease subunit S n=1 Tax=Franconibacter daqui TaxID=2047724 RepID=UPI002DBDECC1|nr:restriction endonuclease subunit S [Franconibacter daqui]
MNGGKLPEGWIVTNLQNIANWGSGGTPSRSHDDYYNGNIPWFKTGDLGPKLITEASEYITDVGVKNSSAKYFPKGSVAIAMYGATIGKTSILGIDATTNQACAVGTPIEGITSSIFLYYFLLNEKNSFIKKGKGGAQPNISQAVIKEHPLSLPPYAEQKIIAEKLDTLLAQVDSTRARLEQIPQILKRFRQAVLASVVCGKLSKNTGQWKTYLLKNICISISDGDHQAPPKSETGIPFLVISDVNKGQIDFENVSRWVPESYYESLKEIRKPFQNDILYTVTGSYGIPVIVNTTKPFCFQRHIAIIKPNSTFIDYKFLAFYLESPQIFKHASDVATGTAQKTVSLSSLRSFELSVPSLEEQHEIVRRVEQLFAYADTIEKQVNSALTRVNSLTQSILAKAFRGELTAQWRAENPDLISGENSAAALLEKIKAERAASGGKKAARKKA